MRIVSGRMGALSLACWYACLTMSVLAALSAAPIPLSLAAIGVGAAFLSGGACLVWKPDARCSLAFAACAGVACLLQCICLLTGMTEWARIAECIFCFSIPFAGAAFFYPLMVLGIGYSKQRRFIARMSCLKAAGMLACYIVLTNPVSESMLASVPSSLMVAAVAVSILMFELLCVALSQYGLRSVAEEETAPLAAEWLLQLDGASELSNRELAVLSGLAGGRSHAEIASELGIALSTVSTYRARGLGKLGLDSACDLVSSMDEFVMHSRKEEGKRRHQRRSLRRLLAKAVLIVLAASLAACFVAGICGAALPGFLNPLLRQFLVSLAVLWAAGICWAEMEHPVRTQDGILSFWYIALILAASCLSLRLAADGSRVSVPVITLGACVLLVDIARKDLPEISTADALQLCGVCSLLLLAGPRGAAATHGMFLGPFEISFAAVRLVSASVAALLLSFLAWMRLQGAAALLEQSALSSKKQEQAILYLRGRGMNELDAEILFMISQGKDTSAIMETLHVARGTVHAARFAGYRMLGIHSAAELASLLAHDVGF